MSAQTNDTSTMQTHEIVFEVLAKTTEQKHRSIGLGWLLVSAQTIMQINVTVLGIRLTGPGHIAYTGL